MNPLVSFHQFFIFALVCHSLTHFIRSSEIMELPRRFVGVRDGNEDSFMHRLVRCPFCTGWWVGIAAAFLVVALSPNGDALCEPFNPLAFGTVEEVVFVFVCSWLSAIVCYVFELVTLFLEESLAEFEHRRG